MTTTFDTYEIPVDFYVEPESSFIDAVGYDETDGACYVVIHGTVYRYGDVFYGDFKDLVTAESVGRQYHEFSKTYGPSRSLPGGGSLALRDDDSETFPEDSEYTSTSAKDAYTDPTVPEESKDSLQRFLENYIPSISTDDEESSLEDLESYDYDEGLTRRVWALQNASVVYQGRKARASEVIATAKKFEEYLNGS